MTTERVPLLENLRVPPQQYLKELLASYGPQAQLFSIRAEQDALVKGAGGARLSFSSRSFADASGKPVEGPVEVRLREAFTLGEMILADRPTASEDRLMESGGQLMIQARQGQELLQLSQPATVDLPVRRNLRNPVAMRLFLGGTSTFQPFSYSSSFDWRMASEKPVRIRKIEGRKYYSFQLQSLTWAGCDFFIARRANRYMVTARPVSTVDKFDGLLAYLAFRDIHAVARMYPGQNGCTAVNVPDKLPATAHVVGLSNGNLYYGAGHLRRASDKLVSVKMRHVVERELAELLRRA